MTSMLTHEMLDLLPSEEDVARYQQTGYYISKKIFTDEEIDNAIAGSNEFYAGKLERPGLPAMEKFMQNYELGGDFGSKLRKHDYASFFRAELTNLIRKPILGAVAAKLAGTDQIRLWHDQLLYKPTHNPDSATNVGWHTDKGYWQMCSSNNLITAWVPFHDCDDKRGTITMIEGSHKWPDNTSQLDFFSSDLDGLQKRFDTGGAEVKKVPMNMEKGQVSFHHCLTIHGSGPNFDPSPRRSIAVHMQDRENQYRDFYLPNGNEGERTLATHQGVIMPKEDTGIIDFSNPDYFPTLYDVE